MEFSFNGFIRGFKSGIPIAIGVASYGLVFGILSRQAGLELLPSLCMSAFVFAGASQFVALDMLATPLPMAAIIVSIIAPQIISGGSPGLIAAAVCTAASLVFKNLIAVMVTGVVTISLLRHFIFI
jgi:branched-subunit amino acid transport protein